MKQLFLILSMLCLTALLMAGISVRYDLKIPVIENGASFARVNLADAQSWGEPGNPDLPWYGVKILLPVGSEAGKINVTRTRPVSYNLTQPLNPIQKQYPFSHAVLEAQTLPLESVYGSAMPYPAQADNGVQTHFLSGNPIAFTAVCPFEYFPLKNELVFYQTLNVEVEYSFSARAAAAAQLLKQDIFTAQRLQKSVDNPEAIQISRTRETGVEYLIVCDQSKIANWMPLQNIHQDRGRNVLIKSMSEITAASPGADTQEKLRNYIISMYSTNPLRYVLLAGDTDVIPHRGFYVNLGTGSESDADIPADMYYSCLDGTWNNDNDANWGEMYEADLAPELAVGRVCYNSDTEISNFINKVMSYMIVPVEAEIKSAFFVGEWLWDGPTWGGDYMDEMIGGSDAHGYTTVGVPTTWNITTLYDRTYGAADSWDASDIRPLLSQGPNFVNHLGHSNTTYTMRLSNNQVSNSTITNNGSNHNFSTYFTQGCYSGAFDNRDTQPGSYTSDCIAEKMMSIANGPVAMLAHSRYGWGMQGSTDGASQYIHRQYMDAVFGEHIQELGYTLVDSKIDNIPYITNTAVMYWVTYETNLFGDPAMMLWTDTPQNVVANLPSQWLVGVNSYQISTNAPYAEFILKSDNNTIISTIANQDGLININLLETLIPGNYQIYINAPNFYGYQTAIQVSAAQMPYVICNNVQYNDPDGLYHTGENILMDFYVKNVGLVDLTQPGSITLTSSSPNLEILNGTTSFQALASGDSLQIVAQLGFGIRGSFSDLTRASLTFTANFAGYTTQSTAFITLNAPHLSIASYQINNSTPVINPGQTPSISLTVNNSGSGNCYNPLMILFPDSGDVVLSQYELSLPFVVHNGTVTLDNVLNVQILDSAELGSSVNIGYILNSENGDVVEGNFIIYIGAISYGFEPDFQGWESIALNQNYTNQWHRSSQRNHTANGQYSMKFGSSSTATYAGSAFGALLSPIMNVSPGCQLKFHHWMEAETHTNPSYAWDGGMVQMSLNGSSWTQITPVGGYPYRIYNNNASPFAAETYVYSGSFDWTEATFELGNISGTAQFRWVFGSDGYVGGEGWYIDDVQVFGVVDNSDETSPAVATLSLFDNYPNPFNPETNLSFSLPHPQNVKLEIYNLKGQLVNTLVNGDLAQGTHRLVWNGKDSKQRSVSSGVYYYRLTTSSGILTKKMLLMK